ncbi:MAG: hypothetical protein K2I10_13860 [Lachnospiraceae bacterium]|nr:hypothetical protein [Lachnospiraceae bacterium]
MNKEEILKKAQKEGNDEMETQMKDRSMRWTYIAMVIAAAVFSFIRDKQGYPIMDITAIVSISVCVGQFYRFIKSKDNSFLIIAMVMLVVSIASTIRFFMGH